MNVCNKCKKELRDDAQLCDNCGSVVAENKADSDVKQTPKKKSLLVPVLIALGALLLFVTAGVFFIIKSKPSVEEDTEWIVKKDLYIKDDEIFLLDMSGKEATQLTSRLDIDREHMNTSIYSLDYGKVVSWDITKDNKRIFFPDKFEEGNYSLYYKDIEKLGKEAVKIDSDLSDESIYFVSDDGNIVTYFEGDDNNLCQYDIKKKKKTKIDSNIEDTWYNIYVENNGEGVYYIKSGGDLYFKKAGKDKEKIDSDVEEILRYRLVYSKKETSSVLYLKDGKVYKKEEGKEKEKLASDVEEVRKSYAKQKSFYYTKEKKESTKVLMDYVEDDMEKKDAEMEEPKEAPKYPSNSDYSSTEEYNKALEAYNETNQEYNKALAEYKDKEKRDKLRKELSEETYESNVSELYYFDGKEEKKLSDNLYKIESLALEEPVIVFNTRKKDDNDKIKLSEITDPYYVRNILDEYDKGEFVIAVGDKLMNIEEDNINSFKLSATGDRVYFFKNINQDKQYGDLYEIEIKNGKLSQPKLYDKKVNIAHVYLYKNNDLVYFKDYEGEKATLYINQKEIDDDVYTRSVSLRYNNSKEVYYYKDYNFRKEKGSLMFYNGSEAKLIEDDVHDFKIRYDGSILYLCNYSLKKLEGDLKLYINGKSRLMDEDVIAIIKRFNYVETLIYGY